MDELDFGKEMNYILYNCYIGKKISMIKIYCERFSLKNIITDKKLYDQFTDKKLYTVSSVKEYYC
jgi:hypothetical protein